MIDDNIKDIKNYFNITKKNVLDELLNSYDNEKLYT